MRGPIKVHYNWELDDSHEIELCDCQTMKCFGLVGIRSYHTDAEKFEHPRTHVNYGGPSRLISSTTRNVMETGIGIYIYHMLC